jgi:peptidyl-prolyl cis-trans isomerase SurA
MTLGRRFLPHASFSLATALVAVAPAARCFAQAQLPASKSPQVVAEGVAQNAKAPQDNLNYRFANGIVAIVEDKIITVDDIRRKVSVHLPQITADSRNEKEFNQKLEALQESIIQDEIDKVLIVKEFYKEKEGEKEKRQIPASYIDNQLSEIIITQYDNDRSKFLAWLRSEGKTVRDYRKVIEEDIVYNFMRHQQRKSQNIVSPVRVETFYNENKDKFYQEDSVHVRLIQFRRTEGETDDQLRERANAAIARFKAGEKFEDIAKELSQDARRSKGGDWGWMNRSLFKPELGDPLFKLSKGEITGQPIVLPEGAFLMYVEDRKYAGIQGIDEVRPQIEAILAQQMARTSQEHWLERLRRNGYIKQYN